MASAFLSAALIVRDEERFLEGCLRSLGGRVDDIVVVDTGSNDHSREIARDFGARVFEYAWNDDFAAARNASIEAARGSWILYIDADERLVEFDRATVERLLSDQRTVCYTVLFRPTTGYTRYREYRLFRNRPDLRFEGMIHESLVPALRMLCSRERLRTSESPVAIDHLGYDGDLRHKHVRNLPLLKARLERDPDHLYCLDQLGLTLRALGDQASAEATWRQAIDVVRKPPRREELADSLPFLHLAQLLLDTKRDAGALLDEACRVFPDNHALTWLRARWLVETGDHAGAMPLFERLAAIDASTMPAAPIAYDASIFGAQAHAALGLCAFRLGRFAESAEHYARAEALAPRDLEIRAKRAVAENRARSA